MSLQAMTFAMTRDLDEVGPRLVLLILAHHINNETHRTFVGQKLICKEARVSERSLRRYLETLEGAGYIKRHERRREDGSRATDEIELLGFEAWLKAIEQGGVVTVEKPVETQPANLAASDPATGHLLAGGPGQSCDRGVRPLLAGIQELKPSLTERLNQTRESAREDVNLDSGKKIAKPRPASAKYPSQFKITPKLDAAQWSAWVTHLRGIGREDLVEAATADGEMIVRARWPEEDCPLPLIEPKALAQPAVRRMQGDRS
jgi:hypothetical protein